MQTDKSKPRILFVDDERFAMRLYVEDLLQEYQVDFLDSVPTALEKFSEHYDAVIIDLLMPPASYGAEAKEGTRTGVLLFREYRKLHPATPVLILTNASAPAILGELQAESNVTIRPKLSVLPDELPNIIRGMLGGR
jgi:CheY-like chemotaxis protein